MIKEQRVTEPAQGDRAVQRWNDTKCSFSMGQSVSPIALSGWTFLHSSHKQFNGSIKPKRILVCNRAKECSVGN